MIAMLRPAGLFLFSVFCAASAFASSASVTVSSAASSVSLASESVSPATDSFLFLPAESTATSPFLTAPDPLSTTLSILTSLALVVVLIFGVAWLLQKRHGLAGSACGRTLGVLPIDSRRFIYIVDVMGRVLVLGVTEQNISMLCEIEDRALIDSLRIQSGGASTIPGLDKVFAFLKRNPSKPVSTDEAAQDVQQGEMPFAEHTRKAQERIRKMEDMIIRRTDPDE